jgi:transcriptional regulator with XRE-family HTH domain
MTRKIPDDAFALYVAMGHERSQRALAEQLGVSKRAITEKASAEHWAERLEAIEADVQARIEAKLKDEVRACARRFARLHAGAPANAYVERV